MPETKVKKAVKDYLREMLVVEGGQSEGRETPHYGAFTSLMNSVFESLDVDILCNLHPSSSDGRRTPDCGFFSKSRCKDGVAPGTNPEFGVVELKRPGTDVRKTAESRQVQDYLDTHGMVLVSNYHDFLLVELAGSGDMQERDFVSLAASKEEFWNLAKQPRKVNEKDATRLADILYQVSVATSKLSDPKEVARILALYARSTLEKLNADESESFHDLQEVLEHGIGTKFEMKNAKEVFRSTLVQTIFYGLFSAWVRNGKNGNFDWRGAQYDIPVPVIQGIFEQLTMARRMRDLGLEGIFNRMAETLNRIERRKFLELFRKEEGAIQHFYELFLTEFDPKVRKDLGVWYTPEEIVKYMVERVNTALRTEMGYADGLADDRVYILDPCCGTGAFVTEVLRKINDIHIREKGDNKKVAAGKVKNAALKRIIGFEYMTAPLMIAHWQVNDYLEKEIEAPLNYKKKEIPRIHLTDSLIEWDKGNDKALLDILIPELKDERKRVRKVKQGDRVLVIIGNPPYNSKFKPTGEKRELAERYNKRLKAEYGIGKNTLTDSYSLFFSVAEKYIVEKRKKGIICFITNYSYTRREGFVKMRKRLAEGFDKIWIDSLNGEVQNGKSKTPDGKDDPSVFSTKVNPGGVAVGISVGLFAKNSQSRELATVQYREFWGQEKRERLLGSLNPDLMSFNRQYEKTSPSRWNLFRFSKLVRDDSYRSWPTINILRNVVPGKRETYITGVSEVRKKALIDIDKQELIDRMKIYFDKRISWKEFHKLDHRMDITAGRYNAKEAREEALGNESFDIENIVPYIFKPFDIRWMYHPRSSKMMSANQNGFRIYQKHGDGFVASRREKGSIVNEGYPVFFTRCLGGYETASGHPRYFPLVSRKVDDGGNKISDLFDSRDSETEVLETTPELDRWFNDLGLRKSCTNQQLEETPLLHALAIAWSPMYLRDNKMNLEVGWPRVPMPTDRLLALESAALGKEVADLLDTENGVVGVTEGSIAKHLRMIGDIKGDDFRLISGKPKATRENSDPEEWSDSERRELEAGFRLIGIEAQRGFELLGPPMDISLNDSTYWSGVPKMVWDCLIGGHQPVKSWISTRRNILKTHPARTEGGGGSWNQKRPSSRMGSCAVSPPLSSWATASTQITQPAATILGSGRGPKTTRTRATPDRRVCVRSASNAMAVTANVPRHEFTLPPPTSTRSRNRYRIDT